MGEGVYGGIEISAREHLYGVQRFDDLQGGGLVLENGREITAVAVRCNLLEPDVRIPPQNLLVSGILGPAVGQGVVQIAQIGDTHGGMDLGHLAVEPVFDDVGVILETEEPDAAEFGVQLLVEREYAAAFRRIQHLGGMETGAGHVAAFHDAAAFVPDSHRVGGVVDDGDAVPFGNGIDGLYLAGVSEDMYRHDGHGVAGDLLLDLFRVDVERLRIDVDKDRCAVLPHDGAYGRDEGEGRRDDFPGLSQRFDGHLQGEGAVAAADHLRHVEIRADFFFETLDKRPVMGHDATFPDTLHQFVDLIERGQGRHGYVDRLLHEFVLLQMSLAPEFFDQIRLTEQAGVVLFPRSVLHDAGMEMQDGLLESVIGGQGPALLFIPFPDDHLRNESGRSRQDPVGIDRSFAAPDLQFAFVVLVHPESDLGGHSVMVDQGRRSVHVHLEALLSVGHGAEDLRRRSEQHRGVFQRVSAAVQQRSSAQILVVPEIVLRPHGKPEGDAVEPDVADFSRGDHVVDGPKLVVEGEHVVLMDGKSFFLCQGEQVFRVLQRRRAGFLDQDMLPGGERLPGPGVVQARGQGKIDRIDLVRLDQRPVTFEQLSAVSVDERLRLGAFLFQNLVGRTGEFLFGGDGDAGEFEATRFPEGGKKPSECDFRGADDADSHVSCILGRKGCSALGCSGNC